MTKILRVKYLALNIESSTIEEGNATNAEDSSADNESADAEGDDDQAEFHADESTKQRPSITPRWPTRVFAAQCIRRIVAACVSDKQAHFDLALAKEMQQSKGKGAIDETLTLPLHRFVGL